MEGKWKDRSKLYKNLKLGDYLLIKFKKFWFLCKVYESFTPSLDNSG